MIVVVGVAAALFVAQAVLSALLIMKISEQAAAERRTLLNRIMARTPVEAAVLDHDVFLDANEAVPTRAVLYDETGLLEVDMTKDE